MLVEEKTIFNDDDSVGYIEAIFNSTNILKTTYFIDDNRLYISFNRGGVYSYSNISPEFYYDFKSANSQGKFFSTKIKKYPDKYPYRKEFTLYPNEIKEAKDIIEENEKNNYITLVKNEFDEWGIGKMISNDFNDHLIYRNEMNEFPNIKKAIIYEIKEVK